jgi:hypothetical protein
MAQRYVTIDNITIDSDGRTITEDGVERPMTPEEDAIYPRYADIVQREAELAQIAAAVAATNAALQQNREDLANALELSALYPAPTPEETVIIDQQVAAALAAFRELDNPPADIVALAAAVISWRAEV